MHVTGQQRFSIAYKWLVLALLLSALFLGYTAVYAFGVLDASTLQFEQWLLHRPITRLDCVFFEWRRLGEVLVSAWFTLLLGIICIRAGYRRRIVPYLLLLLLLSVGVEVVGKNMFAQVLPARLHSGMTTLTCPQMQGEPISVQIATSAVLWWMIPAPLPEQADWARDVSVMPLNFDKITRAYSYPGGHAARWCFFGLLACWLAWRHIKSRLLRSLTMGIALAVAFGGGLMQFYIGVHFVTDTLSGYLLGAAIACCAIGLLLLNDTRKRGHAPQTT